MKNKRIILSDKPYYVGYKCPKCGSKKTYDPMYINCGAPNAQCRKCSFEWFRSPRVMLEVKKKKLGVDHMFHVIRDNSGPVVFVDDSNIKQ